MLTSWATGMAEPWRSPCSRHFLRTSRHASDGSLTNEISGLGERWINLGASRLARFGLPLGFDQRLAPMRFGPRLTLHLLGRQDLLSLKLYAAADDLGPRQAIHMRDLQALNPTFDELDAAVEWVRTLPDFEEKRTELRDVIRSLGYDDLAYYV